MAVSGAKGKRALVASVATRWHFCYRSLPKPLICRVSSAVEQRFCKPLVGGSSPSPGTNEIKYLSPFRRPQLRYRVSGGVNRKRQRPRTAAPAWALALYLLSHLGASGFPGPTGSLGTREFEAGILFLSFACLPQPWSMTACRQKMQLSTNIKALEDRRYRAMIAGDAAVLDELCSDDLIYTHSKGATTTSGVISTKSAPAILPTLRSRTRQTAF